MLNILPEMDKVCMMEYIYRHHNDWGRHRNDWGAASVNLAWGINGVVRGGL
jgi:hypothetical protein